MSFVKEIIPLSQLRTFKNVYREDADWDALLADFQRSPTDWRTIQELVAELDTARFFREPVWVGYPEEDDLSERWVFDGTHRACAYLLAGVLEVEVEFEDDSDQEWLQPTIFTETQIHAVNGYEPDIDGDRAAGSVGMWSALLSMRLDEHTWLTSDASFTDSGLRQVTVAWDSLAAQVATAIITARVREQLAHFGFDVDRLIIETFRRIDADNE